MEIRLLSHQSFFETSLDKDGSPDVDRDAFPTDSYELNNLIERFLRQAAEETSPSS